MRLARGETADLRIMVGYALDEMLRRGHVQAGSRVDWARSPIGLAARAGQPQPHISSVEALRAGLLAAQSVAYSDSASGVYVSTELLQKLGIAEAMKTKARMIPGEPVAAVVASQSAAPEAARALIRYLASDAATAAIRASGLTPMGDPQ